MRNTFTLKATFVVALTAVLAFGCNKSSTTPEDEAGGGTASTASVVGHLEGDDGGIAGADVVLHTTNQRTTTDANGDFVFSEVPDGTLAFEFVAVGHSEYTRRILVEKHRPYSLWVNMKPLSDPVTITIPVAGDEAEVVVGPNGRNRLTIGVGTVADPADDSLASGEIDVRITPFNVNDPADIERLPADLLAEPAAEGGDPEPLFTYGMALITMHQGDKELNVKKEERLLWDVAINEERKEYTAEHNPDLYYLQMDSGLWRKEGVGVYNEESGWVTLELPHLSDPNVDAPPPPPTGCAKVEVTVNGGHEPNREVQLTVHDVQRRDGNCFEYVCVGNQNRGRVRAHVGGNQWVNQGIGNLPCGGGSCPGCATTPVDLVVPEDKCPPQEEDGDPWRYKPCTNDSECCLGWICDDKTCVFRPE